MDLSSVFDFYAAFVPVNTPEGRSQSLAITIFTLAVLHCLVVFYKNEGVNILSVNIHYSFAYSIKSMTRQRLISNAIRLKY